MSSFEICLFFDKIEFQSNYQGIFSTIKDLLNEIESDCHAIDENTKKPPKIYLSFCCNLLDDLDFITEPILTLEERHIEDWSGLSFGGRSFIDFRQFPWLEEASVVSQ